MTSSRPAVALVFDDNELGGQLREALAEHGARIVHEGGIAALNRELLARVGADVLVVNLDEAEDDELDHLYDLVDGDRPRLVFNDAGATRKLEGWDRARWARHLAVKVLEAGDVDPPRPENAPGIEVASSLPVLSDEQPAEMEAVMEAPSVGEPFASAEPAAAVSSFDAGAEVGESLSATSQDDVLPQEQEDGFTGNTGNASASIESESLAAELEALLAAGDLPEEEEVTGSGLRFGVDDELPALHDGNFGVAVEDVGETLDLDPEESPDTKAVARGEPPALAGFDLDHLQLTLADEEAIPSAAPFAPAPAAVSAPDSWALLDEDVLLTEPAADATAFGIEKLSAADFLAPESDGSGHHEEPVMTLELVSMEEAIAPRTYEPVSEMKLDEVVSAIGRVVVLGATAEGVDSVCEFLAGVPKDSHLTFLHTQRPGSEPLSAVVAHLATHCRLPVRLASQGNIARRGEVLVVPEDAAVSLRRDGGIDCTPALEGPSIDTSFSMAAQTFGSEVVAIVFAGRATDAVGGAQAIHDRGGQVWVESSSDDHFADMVQGIVAERLVSFSGTPQELAARLVEVYP